jgi:hypothetical protein
VGLAGVQRGDDVRVPQRPDRPHLRPEPHQEPRVLVRGQRQHLDRRRAAEQDVLGPVDDAHAAGPEAVQHPVVAQDQAEIAAGPQPPGLVSSEQPVLDQPLEERGRLRPAGQLLLHRP